MQTVTQIILLSKFQSGHKIRGNKSKQSFFILFINKVI